MSSKAAKEVAAHTILEEKVSENTPYTRPWEDIRRVLACQADNRLMKKYINHFDDYIFLNE